MRNIISIIMASLLITLFSGCVAQSKIAYSPAPLPPSGAGLIYIYNEEKPGNFSSPSQVTIKSSAGDLTSVYLVPGEYTWIHLNAGKYTATYMYSATLTPISIHLDVEDGKVHFIEFSFKDKNFVTIKNISEKLAMDKKMDSYKYWEYKRKDCILVANCR